MLKLLWILSLSDAFEAYYVHSIRAQQRFQSLIQSLQQTAPCAVCSWTKLRFILLVVLALRFCFHCWCLYICLHFIFLPFSLEVWDTLVAASAHTHADWSKEWYWNPLLHVWLTAGKEHTATLAASTVRRVTGKQDERRRKEWEEVLITSVACSTVRAETQTSGLADCTANMPISRSHSPRFLYLLTSCLVYSDDTPYGQRQCFP